MTTPSNTLAPTFGAENTEVLTPAQARTQAFPWEVQSSPLVMSSTFNPVTSHKANYRSDTGECIGVVGAGYSPISNDQFVEFAEATGLMAHAAGIREGGSQVWMQLRIEDGEFLPGVDPHARYVWVANAHDGSGALIVRPTMVRVQCLNQWFYLRKNHKMGGEVTLRHTKNVQSRVEQAKFVVSKAFDRFASMEADIERMLNQETTQIGDLFKKVFGPRPELNEDGTGQRKQTIWENRFEDIATRLASDTCANIADTDYGKVMAIQEWEQKHGKNPDQQGRIIRGFPRTARATELVLAGSAN